MGTNAPTRPSTGRPGVAFAVGLVLGVGLVFPGWSKPLELVPSGQFGAAVGLAVAGLLVFTLVLWLVVVVFVIR